MADEKEEAVEGEFTEVSDETIDTLQQRYFDKALVALITRQTPKEVVLRRPGRGKQTFRYVPVAWFIDQLNILFGFNWDFQIMEQGELKDKQVWVRGKLVVRTIQTGGETITITKEQFGGSDIKKVKDSNTIIDYADDLKSASSDCLKKCATLLGLAWDVYSGAREAMTEAAPDTTQLLAFYKRGEEAGFTKEALDEWFTKQEDINKEGKKPGEAVEAEILGAFVKLRELRKAKEAEESQ